MIAYVDHAHRHRRGGSDPVEETGAAFEIKVFGDTVDATTGDGKIAIAIPHDLDGVKLTEVGAFVTTPSSSGLPTVQLRNVTTGFDLLTTRLTIDVGEKNTRYATTPAVIDPAHATVAWADEIAIDVDVAGTGAKGLGVTLTFGAPPGGVAYGPPGPAGPPGPPGADGGRYVHVQSALASTWVVTHPLAAYPSVSVVDTGGTEVIPNVHYDSTSQLTIDFGAPTSGVAYLN